MEGTTFCAAYTPEHWNYSQELVKSQEKLNATLQLLVVVLLSATYDLSHLHFFSNMSPGVIPGEIPGIDYPNGCTYEAIYEITDKMRNDTIEVGANSNSSNELYFHAIGTYAEKLTSCGYFWITYLGLYLQNIVDAIGGPILTGSDFEFLSDIAYFSSNLVIEGRSVGTRGKDTHRDMNTTLAHIEELKGNISMLKKLYPLCMFEFTVEFTLFGVGLPAICVSGYILFRLLRANRTTPAVIIISLLITDLIHILTRVVHFLLTGHLFFHVDETLSLVKSYFLHFIVLFNVLLMLCISLERYTMVTLPLWFQRHHSIKSSVLVCVYTLILSCLSTLAFVHSNMVVVLYTLPLPLLLFFTVGTCRALTASPSVSRVERNKILGLLILVLSTYILLFLPYISVLIYSHASKSHNDLLMIIVSKATMYWSHLNCLVDPLLYIFLRPDARDTLQTGHV